MTWRWLVPVGKWIAKTLATEAAEKLAEGLTGRPTSAPPAAPPPVTGTRKRRRGATAAGKSSR